MDPDAIPEHISLALAGLIRSARDKGVFLALYLRPPGAFLDTLRVRDDLRNQGIGSHVMGEVTCWADCFKLAISLRADAGYKLVRESPVLQCGDESARRSRDLRMMS